MKKNESGFTAIEVVLVVALVALIGAAGWYAFNARNKSSSSTTSYKTSTQTSATPTPAADWKTYENHNLFVRFDHPSTWGVTTKEVKQDQTYNYVYAKSPDFVPQDANSATPTPKQGAVFSVLVSPNKFNWKTIAEATKDVPGFASPTSRSIDGLSALTGSPSYNSITTRVLRPENYVDLTYYYVEGKKDANLADYTKWVDSFKLQESSFPVGN